jgi:hypothetical protein
LLVTHQSPLIKWITHENLRADGAFYGLSALRSACTDWPEGIYVYRVERWKFKGLRDREHLAYGLAKLGAASVFDAEASERFFQSVLHDSETWHEPGVSSESVLVMYQEVQSVLLERFHRLHDQFVAENKDTLAIHLAQVQNHFQRRLAANQQRKLTLQSRRRRASMIALVEANIAKDQARLDEKTHELKEKAKPASDFSEVASGIVQVIR